MHVAGASEERWQAMKKRDDVNAGTPPLAALRFLSSRAASRAQSEKPKFVKGVPVG